VENIALFACQGAPRLAGVGLITDHAPAATSTPSKRSTDLPAHRASSIVRHGPAADST